MSERPAGARSTVPALPDLSAYLADRFSLIDGALERMLPAADAFPDVVHRAMRYSVFAGGKRIRPLLVIAAAETAGGMAGAVLPAACAIEMIHTYSLIHDDLPSMDNSAVRRGRPTCHVVFDEAIAVLAGDALHALAFELLAGGSPPAAPAVVVTIIREIAWAIGTEGMVGGQVLDLLAEGRPSLPAPEAWRGDGSRAVRDIHTRKTAALIRASVRAGALVSGARADVLEALTRYGERVGLAFQIVDDVLDEVGEAGRMGKDAQRDAVSSKLTYPAVFGVEASRGMAAALTAEAVGALEGLGPTADLLVGLARLLLERDG